MLRLDREWMYKVYPKWLTGLSFSWGDLPGLFSNPRGSRFWDATNQAAWERGYIRDYCEEWMLLPSPHGNGIIKHRVPPRHPWTGDSILFSHVGLQAPSGLTGDPNPPCHVGGMEYLNLPAIMYAFQGKLRPRNYICSETYEHVENAGDDAYWALLIKTTKVKKAISEWGVFRDYAAGFGFQVMLCEAPPPFPEIERDRWFGERELSKHTPVWFHLPQRDDPLGFHVAVAYYCASAWNGDLKGAVWCIDVAADIEEKKGCRRFWSKGLS